MLNPLKSFALIFILFALGIFSNQALGQCVTCQSAGGCYDCVASTESGGLRCRPTRCTTCTVTGICRPSGANGLSKELGPLSVVKLKPDTIREIAKVHPRFAIALLSVTNGDIEGGYAQVHLAPLNVTSEDVEWWLKPEEESADYFEALALEGRETNSSEAKPIVYEFTLERSPEDSLLATLKLRVLNGHPTDPLYSALEITLTRSEKPSSTKSVWEVKKWKVY